MFNIWSIVWGTIFTLIIFLGQYFWKKKQKGDSEFQKTQEIIAQIRKTVLNQILNNNDKLFAAIAKQKIILNDQGRKGIAIFISPDMFKELLKNEGSSKDDQIETLYEIMKDLRTPVGFLGDLPIYISELLTETPIFVVGGIYWNL